MAQKIIRDVPLNRVEGDLEVKVELKDGVVSEAWCSGTMFRGFEKILVGRGVLDGLVITPRVCGLCSMCHLTAAAKALDMIAGVRVPDDALRIRNICNMAENVQSDMRHGFLMFAADFTNPAYKGLGLFEEASRRYRALAGDTVLEVVRNTRTLLELMAILGGQWPHSSFMVPGGVSSIPSVSDTLQCRHLLSRFRTWYEKRILGCAIERWHEVRGAAGLDAWLEEKESHRDSDVGFYIRFCREAGLDRIGKGVGNFLSFGAFDMPEHTSAVSMGKGTHFVPAGFSAGTRPGWFDQGKVTEHVHYSWCDSYEGGKHPMEGSTEPYASGREGEKYSWSKAPRYDGEPAETGPLAEMIIAENPLFADMVSRPGPSVFSRELARLVRPAFLLPVMDLWLREIDHRKQKFYEDPGKIVDGEGFGLTEAARGALGHWVKIENGRIAHYQIITPTAWNASPRDSQGRRGPWEEALLGTKVGDADNPVELGHIVRSFDSCMVCCVHAIRPGRTRRIVL
jgi:Ni,Fe-hydrogenase I large subunit